MEGDRWPSVTLEGGCQSRLARERVGMRRQRSLRGLPVGPLWWHCSSCVAALPAAVTCRWSWLRLLPGKA